VIHQLSNAVLYLDTSALVKHYMAEIGSAWLNSFFASQPRYTFATVNLTQAEAAAAFAGKHRQGGLAQSNYTDALADLAHDFAYVYFAVYIDQELIDLAVQLTTRQKLRGCDAIQLAAALTLNDVLMQTRLPALSFIAADNDLLIAAENEGLVVDNPNLHP
jgi:uncharacterized protein